MNENNCVSLVLYATEMKQLRETFESIKKQKEKAQLLIVTRQEDAAFLQDIKKYCGADAQYCQVDSRFDLKFVLTQVTGEFVFFIKEGVRLKGQALEKIAACVQKTQKDTILLPLKTLKANYIMDEYDIFDETLKQGGSLIENPNLTHCMYFTYGMRVSELVIDEALVPSDWEIEVLKMICRHCYYHPQAVLCADAFAWVESFSFAMKQWERFLDTPDGIHFFYERLYLPLYQMWKTPGLAAAKNASYVLLYFSNRLIHAVNKLSGGGKAFDAQIIPTIREVLEKVQDAQMIAESLYMTFSTKHYILKHFYQEIGIGDAQATDLILDEKNRSLFVCIFEVKNHMLHIEFRLNQMDGEAFEILCTNGKDKYACHQTGTFSQAYFLGEKVGQTNVFEVTLPLFKKTQIRFLCKQGKQERVFDFLKFTNFVPFDNHVFLYKKLENALFFINQKQNAIMMRPVSPLLAARLEIKHIHSLMKQGKPGFKALIARGMYHFYKQFQKEEIWLLSDRADRADDNGEVMLRYLHDNPRDGVKTYYVIDKKTEDWERMQQYGETVVPFSAKHKLLFLLNDLSLSSQANRMVVNPFGGYGYLYRDIICDKKLVFLQHGITKDNQSAWLNKYNRNLFGLVVTTQPEYDSMFEYNYFYTPKRIWLTGMPRYDRLYHDEKKYVTIMPTWRKSLSPGTDDNGIWLIGEDFEQSEYFKFYNDLLNEERLIQEAEKLGYQICFMPHPNTIAGLKRFKKHPKVQFFDMKKSYRDVFAQTDLMVTDYSSVAFDFAYLRKPIVYSQFDREDFFNGNHSYTEGYFNYETDGFGEVEHSRQAVVDRLIEYMQSDCQLKQEYRERIDKTFAFNDQGCCRRVCEMIDKYVR